MSETDQALIRKVIRRLIPFLILCFLLNFIDRTNITIAKNSMADPEVGIADWANFLSYFNMGLAIFYIPYCLLEVPSNLIQERVGARRWISRIMISWGLVSTLFIFVEGKWSFFTLRILLGVMEAGFFPGIILYMTYWIPKAYRARASALFFLSTAIAQVIGNGVGGFILFLAGKYEWYGRPWQWLFALEGIPSMSVGVMVLYYLTDKPQDAKWLTPEERNRLDEIMAADKAAASGGVTQSSGHGLKDFAHALAVPMTWVLSALYAAMCWAYNPVQFYLPTIFKTVLINAGVIVDKAAVEKNPTLTLTPQFMVDLYTGLLSAIPFAAAGTVMILIARHSDRSNKRKPHLIGSCALLGIGLAMAAVTTQYATGTTATVMSVVSLSLAAIGWFGAFALIWSLPAQLMTAAALAAGTGLINSWGNFIGNFVGPPVRDLFPKEYAISGPLMLSAFWAFVAVGITAMIRMTPVRPPRGFDVVDDKKTEKVTT